MPAGLHHRRWKIESRDPPTVTRDVARTSGEPWKFKIITSRRYCYRKFEDVLISQTRHLPTEQFETETETLFSLQACASRSSRPPWCVLTAARRVQSEIFSETISSRRGVAPARSSSAWRSASYYTRPRRVKLKWTWLVALIVTSKSSIRALLKKRLLKLINLYLQIFQNE